MNWHRLNLSLIVFLNGILINTQALGQNLTSEADSNQELQNMILFNPVMTPGSTGSFGSSVGVIQHEYQLTDKTLLNEMHFHPDQNNSIKIQKLVWNKGTPWPLDFSIALGKNDVHSITDWHGAIQWTFFEGKQLPSVSTRIFYRQIYNFSSLNLRNIGGELSAGYAFLRYFQVFSTFGYHLTSGQFSPVQDHPVWGLINEVEKADYQFEKKNIHLRYGVSIKPHIPYLKLSAEAVAYPVATSPSFSVIVGY